MTDTVPTQTYSELNALRTFMGKPSELATKKSITRLDKHCREFLAQLYDPGYLRSISMNTNSKSLLLMTLCSTPALRA